MSLGRQMRRAAERRDRERKRASSIASRQKAPALSLSHGQPADDLGRLELLDRLDNFSGVRNALRRIAQRDGEWAGIPMPLEGQRLVIEPTYPKADKLAEIGVASEEKREPPPGTVRNTFWSTKLRSTVVVREIGGKAMAYVIPGVNHLGHDLETLRSSEAWGLEQESRAVHKLGELLPHARFKRYLLTGMFAERSKRSGILYIFRKLRPTIAIRARDTGDIRVLAALCMHPIGYYQGSWAGAMCPTDDVIAALMMMRGDEPMFWRRANQHAPHLPEAGL